MQGQDRASDTIRPRRPIQTPAHIQRPATNRRNPRESIRARQRQIAKPDLVQIHRRPADHTVHRQQPPRAHIPRNIRPRRTHRKQRRKGHRANTNCTMTELS